MAKDENLNLLESMKEAIVKDPHLHDRVLEIIRHIRSTTGQSMNEYIKNKEFAEKDPIGMRKNKKKDLK